MNAGSLSLRKQSTMKASFFVKLFFVLPLILFIDYILMALLGCTTCLFGFGNEFYCGPFCLTGKIILALSALFFGYLLYPEIKALLKSKKNVAATESKKDQ
jgi:hypothetical protein